MTRKDINLIAEAYQSVQDWFDDALKNPTNYILSVDTMDDVDYEGASIQRDTYTLYKHGERGYDSISNYDDIDRIVDAFEKMNPDGIQDNR
jgi:hypothetical protein